MTYITFLPDYYSSLITGQKEDLFISNQYFFVADGVTKDAIANSNPKTDADEQVVLNEIMYGGRLDSDNIIMLVRRINWEYNKVFTQYSSTDPDLSDKDFYCYTSTRSVYKCLDNNNGAPSTIEPNTIEQGPFKLADGYIWQFLYRLTENEVGNYAIGNYLPVFNQANTEAAAIPGTISTIEVVDGGNYAAVHTGSILEVANTTVVRIDATALSTSGNYNKSGLYITGGPGAGSIAQIEQYTSNSSGKWVELDRPITVTTSSSYEISPYVRVSGNGEGATARSIMNGNEVISVDILNRGSDYTISNAVLEANTDHSVSGSLAVNLSPSRGHGGDITHDLYAESILIHVALDNYTISNLNVNDLTFAKIGILRNPITEANTLAVYTSNTFNSTFTMQVTPAFGTYSVGDTIKLTTSDNPTARIVYANTTHVIGVYQHKTLRFAPDNIIENQNGVVGTVVSIEQPDVRFSNTDILALINTDTITREVNSNETLQVVLRIK